MAVPRIAALCSLALLTLAPRLSAQDSTRSTGMYLFGAGVNLQGHQVAAPAFQFGREWRAPNSRFGLRLSTEYTSSAQGPMVLYNSTDFAPVGTVSSRDRDLSLSLLTTFALTKGRIQPYLLSGFMVQERFHRTSFDAAPNAALQSFLDRSTNFAVGVQAGFGVQARVGGVTLFSEARTQIPALSGAVMRPSASPLTFGVRF